MNNEYVKRKVALKDMQSCIICQKPVTTVLYNQSGPDWLYTCDIHLRDNTNFVIPQYNNEYESTLQELQKVKLQLKIQASNGTGSWDTWISKIFVKKSTSDKDNDDEDSKKKIETDLEESKAPPVNMQAEYNRLVDKMTELQQKNRNYKLSDNMFMHRTQLKRKQELLIAKRKQEEANYSNTDPNELKAKFSFPDVPNAELT